MALTTSFKELLPSWGIVLTGFFGAGVIAFFCADALMLIKHTSKSMPGKKNNFFFISGLFG
jgi:hypothetical protein